MMCVQDERYQATEKVLANRSVLATFTVWALTTATAGTYTLVATNAGGVLPVTFDLQPATQPPPGSGGGLSAGQTAGVVIAVVLLAGLVTGFGVLWWKYSQGKQPYHRFEGGTLEQAEGGITPLAPVVAEGTVEEGAHIRPALRSYGGTDTNPFEAQPADPDPKVV